LLLTVKYFSAVQNYFPIAGIDVVAHFSIFGHAICVIFIVIFLRYVIVFSGYLLRVNIGKKNQSHQKASNEKA
jgi:hypothetical protein